MCNRALFRRELRNGVKLLLIFAAILTLYVACIVTLYDPATVEMLDGFSRAMPELMAAVGMTGGSADLLGFLVSYLYGFILLVFPMVFSILRGNGLIARYVDSGAMVYLLAAPVKRRTVAVTQMAVLLWEVFLLLAYTTALEAVLAQVLFPGALPLPALLTLNLGLWALHMAIAGICFFASCLCHEAKHSALLGAGLPALMYLFQMAANVGDGVKALRYASLFTLFDPSGLAAGDSAALGKAAALLLAAAILYPAGVAVFSRKDLSI